MLVKLSKNNNMKALFQFYVLIYMGSMVIQTVNCLWLVWFLSTMFYMDPILTYNTMSSICYAWWEGFDIKFRNGYWSKSG